MRKVIFIAGAAAVAGSAIAVAQMPPPPPVPPGATIVMEAPTGERREMRRIIIRGDDVGMRGMGAADLIGGGGAMGVMGSLGSFLDTRAIENMTRGLDLTPQQLGKMTEYVATARPEIRKLAEEMSAESRRLRDLSPTDAKYAAASNEAAKRIGELTGRMVAENAALRAKVWGLLTPEQRAKAETQAKEMRERMQDRMKDRRSRSDRTERPRVMFFELDRDAV